MAMTEKGKSVRSEYYKEWRKNHPEAVARYRQNEKDKRDRDRKLLEKLLKEREQWLLTGEKAVDAD